MPLTSREAFSLLQKADAQQRLAHAYLITGPEGSGKRQLAEDLCRLITRTEGGDPFALPDVHVVGPESKSRRIVTDQVREMEREIQMRSSAGGRKAGVILDADRLQPQAANAFLKTLEEPPAGTHLLLLSSLPDQLLDTILSRCIEVPLSPAGTPERTASQQALLVALSEFARGKRAELPAVFGLVRKFQGLLAEVREASQAQGEAELKKEEQRYKQIADAKYFEGREEHFKAASESRYIGERARLLDTLEMWWADVLRQQVLGAGGSDPITDGSGAVALDFPDYAPDTAILAHRHGTEDALRRCGALGTLRDHLRNSGMQEGLAIEVAFLKAFGEEE